MKKIIFFSLLISSATLVMSTPLKFGVFEVITTPTHILERKVENQEASLDISVAKTSKSLMSDSLRQLKKFPFWVLPPLALLSMTVSVTQEASYFQKTTHSIACAGLVYYLNSLIKFLIQEGTAKYNYLEALEKRLEPISRK